MTFTLATTVCIPISCNVNAYFHCGDRLTSSFSTLRLVELIVGIQLISMVIQVRLSSSTRVSTCVTPILTVVGVALHLAF